MSWHKTSAGEVFTDGTGKIIGEVYDSTIADRRVTGAMFGDGFLGRYIHRNAARHAVEAMAFNKIIDEDEQSLVKGKE